MALPDAAVIEVIEYTDDPDPIAIIPNDVKINGVSVLASGDHPVVVHEVVADSSSVVYVTLTLIAKRVTFGTEAKPT